MTQGLIGEEALNRHPDKDPPLRRLDPSAGAGENRLDAVMGAIEAGAANGQDKISLGTLLRQIGMRGFGPILVIMSGLLILPVGMIPGVPAAVAIVLGLVAIELVSGGKALRLPGRVAQLKLRASLVQSAAHRARPVTRMIGRLLRARAMKLATSSAAHIAIGVVLGAIAAVMFVVGFVPALPFLLAIPVCVIGLGLTARDGLVVAIGMATATLPMVLVVRTLI